VANPAISVYSADMADMNRFFDLVSSEDPHCDTGDPSDSADASDGDDDSLRDFVVPDSDPEIAADLTRCCSDSSELDETRFFSGLEDKMSPGDGDVGLEKNSHNNKNDSCLDITYLLSVADAAQAMLNDVREHLDTIVQFCRKWTPKEELRKQPSLCEACGATLCEACGATQETLKMRRLARRARRRALTVLDDDDHDDDDHHDDCCEKV